jgi:hypothetical protein
MSKDSEPTQTTPKGETIPVPARKDVLDALRKAAKVGDAPTDEQERHPAN